MLHRILHKMADYYRRQNAGKPLRIYQIDGFTLDLGENHMLSLIQKNHPMYDRFVPFLGKLADAVSIGQDDSYIIDIGANVGDTVAGLIRHTKSNVICVEPTQKFYKLCKKNIENFGESFTKRIQLANAYISDSVDEAFVSKVINGTASKEKVENHAEAPTCTIPMLCDELNVCLEQLALVKVDTDGFDADCINSFGVKLRDISPVLYWENEIHTDAQLDKYKQMVNYLDDAGYKDFYVFDNFGNYLCKVDSTGMKNIDDYLGRIMHGNSTRSFYYVDVLGVKIDLVEACNKIIDAYLKEWEPYTVS